MPRSPWPALAMVVTASVLIAGGCGGDDAADEQEGTVGEVDIDDETVRYRSEDGEAVFELDQEGKVRVTGDEGETVMTHGEGTELPERWPEGLTLPDDMTLTSASTMTVDGQIRVNVTGDLPGDPRSVHDDLESRLVAAGFDLQGVSLQDDDGRVFGTISATSETAQVAVTVTGEGESVAVSIFLGLTP